MGILLAGILRILPTGNRAVPGAYPGAQCVDCVSGWPTEGAAVDTAGASFDISLSTSGWYDAGVAPDYNLAPGTSTPGQPTYVPGQIVTRLPVGCAAPYTRGAAFYLCGDTWFSGVYGSGGELYYRVISVPGYLRSSSCTMSLSVGAQRKLPLCPSEYRPGCGKTARPCGPLPTLIRATTCPSRVSNA